MQSIILLALSKCPESQRKVALGTLVSERLLHVSTAQRLYEELGNMNFSYDRRSSEKGMEEEETL